MRSVAAIIGRAAIDEAARQAGLQLGRGGLVGTDMAAETRSVRRKLMSPSG
jgi:hypothetical protein